MNSAGKARAILSAISQEAEAKWGKDWQIQIVRAYCEVESQDTGEEVKPVNRRKQVLRAFEEGNCTLESLCRLATATGIDLELTAKRKIAIAPPCE